MLESQSKVPLTIVSTLTATPGKEQQLRAAMLAAVGPSRRDPGNIDFNIHLSKDSAGEFVIVEHWIDEAALAKHKTSEAFTNLLRVTKDGGLIQDGPHEHHLSSITSAE